MEVFTGLQKDIKIKMSNLKAKCKRGDKTFDEIAQITKIICELKSFRKIISFAAESDDQSKDIVIIHQMSFINLFYMIHIQDHKHAKTRFAGRKPDRRENWQKND